MIFFIFSFFLLLLLKNFLTFVEIPVGEYIFCKCERLKILSYIGTQIIKSKYYESVSTINK